MGGTDSRLHVGALNTMIAYKGAKGSVVAVIAAIALALGLALAASQPSQAFADDLTAGDLAAAQDEPIVLVVAPLVDHGPAGGVDPETPMEPQAYGINYTQGSGNTWNVALSGTGFEKHNNANHMEAYWIGVGVPYRDGDLFAAGYNSCPENPNYGDNGAEYDFSGKPYRTFYWGTYSTFKDKTAYVTVKHSDNSVVVYNVTFEGTSCKHEIITGAMSHGKVAVDGVTATTTYANDGDDVTLTITPDNGYELDTLTVKDSEMQDVSVTNNTFTMPAKDVTVTASFKELYDVNVDQSEGGTVTPDRNTAGAGDTVTLDIEADAGYSLDKVSVKQGDTDVPLENNAFEMPAGAVTVSATFTKNVYNVETAVGIQHGYVTTDRDKASIGDQVLVSPYPDTGYMVDKLTYKDDNGFEQDITSGVVVMPASNVCVFATFTKKPYSVDIAVTENGTVTADKKTATMGDTVNLTTKPADGYALESLTVEDYNGHSYPVTDNSFTMPAASVKVISVFKKGNSVTIASDIENGSLSTDKTVAAKSETVTLTATPASGYVVDKIIVKDANGKTVTVKSDGTFTMPATSVTASATFKPAEADTQVMYRLYNPNSGEHFYTASEKERDATAAAGWTYEGVGWTAPTTGDPVYRLYNPNAGDHHYTLSLEEKDALVSLGWTYEAIGWCSAGSDGVPLYRQYNPNAETGTHNYTTSKKESDALVSLGWVYEGIGWYGV